MLHIAASGQLESGIRASGPLPAVPEKHTNPSVTPVQSTLHKALQILTENRTKALRRNMDTVYGWNIGVYVCVNCNLCCKLTCALSCVNSEANEILHYKLFIIALI